MPILPNNFFRVSLFYYYYHAALPITGLNNNEYHISRGQVLNGKVGLDQSCSFVRVVKLQIKLIFYELCNNSWPTESLLTQYLPLNSSWSTFTKNLVVPIKNGSLDREGFFLVLLPLK